MVRMLMTAIIAGLVAFIAMALPGGTSTTPATAPPSLRVNVDKPRDAFSHGTDAADSKPADLESGPWFAIVAVFPIDGRPPFEAANGLMRSSRYATRSDCIAGTRAALIDVAWSGSIRCIRDDDDQQLARSRTPVPIQVLPDVEPTR